MYYRDEHGNPSQYPNDYRHAYYSNSINAGGLSKENFSYTDVTSWVEKHKMWFVYAIVAVLLLMIVRWAMNSYGGGKRSGSGPASVFY